MPEVSGAIPVVELAPLLWALPLLPLAGALFAAWTSRSEGEQASADYGAPVATWLALLSSLLLSYRLSNLGQGARALVAPGPVAGRVGSIDLHLGLSLDATSALFAVLLLLIASAAQLGLLLSPGRGARGAWTAACTAAALLSVLSSSLLAVSVGAGAMVLLGALAAGGFKRPGGAIGAAPLLGDALIFAGGAAVVWGLSGSWISGELLLSDRPSFVVLVRGAEKNRMVPVNSAQPVGFLTLMTGPSTRVFIDNDSKPLAEAPFVRAPIPTGPHSFVIDPGPGADRVEVRKVKVPENSEVVLVRASGASELLGATSLLALRSEGKPVFSQGRLASERWGGWSVSSWAGALLSLGLLLRLWPQQAAASAALPLSLVLPQAGGLLVAGAMGARWLPLLGASADYPAWVCWVLLAGASALSLLGLSRWQPGQVFGLGAASCAAVGLSACAAGAPGAGALLIAAAALALALSLWTLALVDRGPEAPWDLSSYQGAGASVEGVVRWFKVAYAALIGLAPLGFAWLEALRPLDTPARALLALSVLLSSASLGRAVYLISEGQGPPHQPPRNMRRDGEREEDGGEASLPPQVAPALAALLALIGPLGAASIYGAPLASWLASAPSPRSMVPPATVWTFCTWFALSAVGLLGARWARGRYGADRKDDWAAADERSPLALPSRLASLAGAALLALAAGVARAGVRLSMAPGAEEKSS